ncbi:MAG: acetate--CoA ligase family protein [Candidatus Woesearchaeota archaeon]
MKKLLDKLKSLKTFQDNFSEKINEDNKNKTTSFEKNKQENNSNLLSQKNAILLLKEYNINFPDIFIVDNKKDLEHIKIDFPVVLKVDSPEIIHKTDFGLVYTNINNFLELYKKIDLIETILKNKKIEHYNLVIQKMIFGKELILGMKTDPIFGKSILLGLGGIYTEILKDFSVRVLPITKEDCHEMISELKSKKFLENYRNTKSINFESLINLMLNFSNLAEKENFFEIDFNPVIANENDCYVVDARFINKPKEHIKIQQKLDKFDIQ